MKKSYWVGKEEKHRIDFRIHWLSGLAVIACDGKTLFRKPFFFKIDQSVEIGESEKHVICVRFNLFDYFGDRLQLTINGQNPTPDMEIQEVHEKSETPVDDAAAAFFFVAVVNVIFSVIGTLYVPDLNALVDRLMLLLGGLIYFWFAVKTLAGNKRMMIAGLVFFIFDSACRLLLTFSLGGFVERILILIYLINGFRHLRIHQLKLG